MKHSLIIPTVKTTVLVAQCVNSIRAFERQKDYEIIVVDDGSSSSVQAWLRNYCAEQKVKLLLRAKNLGFASAVNWGIKESTGEIVTLVNNDIIFTQSILPEIEESFQSSSLGILGARLLYPDRTIQHAGLLFDPGNRRFIHNHKHRPGNFKQAGEAQYYIAVTGALFSFRRSLYNTLGPLNEKYFVACEDVEYCLRAWNNGYTVLYNPRVVAIHEEGGTRGNTPGTKTKKGSQWIVKEKQSIARFNKDLDSYNLKAIQDKVFLLNLKGVKKLEVGSGFNPHPGYIHVDVRAGLPDLQYVCDFSKDRLPFPDSIFDELLANHVIEHISWRKLPFVLGEWFRVLSKQGKLVLRTPNLRFIVETYLAGKTTPEWPGDEKFIKDNLSSSVTPAWWANIKLFSGQDYDANFHHVCFDFPMLSDLLKRIGFREVKEVKFDKTFSPGELQVEAYK